MGAKSERRLALAHLIQKYDTVSAMELTKYLKSDYGITTTRQTVTEDLKTDIDKFINVNEDATQQSILGELEKLIKVMLTSGLDGNVQAANTYNGLIKTKTDIIAKFHKMKLEVTEAKRPIYHVSIGKPEEVKKENKNNETNESSNE